MQERTVGELIVELKKLKLREARIILLLERENNRTNDCEVRQATFVTGDRVHIKSRLRKPNNWDKATLWDERTARNATVTRVEPDTRTAQDKVFIITDNGVQTWRLASNLRPIIDGDERTRCHC